MSRIPFHSRRLALLGLIVLVCIVFLVSRGEWKYKSNPQDVLSFRGGGSSRIISPSVMDKSSDNQNRNKNNPINTNVPKEQQHASPHLDDVSPSVPPPPMINIIPSQPPSPENIGLHHPTIIKAFQVMNEWSSIAGYNNKSLTNWTFPSLIHTKWNDERSIPDRARECVNGWRDMNPGFTVLVWTDESTNILMKTIYPHLYPVWSTLPRSVMKVDFSRAAMIASFGGVWADIDACPLKPLSAWSVLPGDGLVVGVEADMESPSWPRFFARQFQFETWTFAGIPGHPALMQFLHMAHAACVARRQYPTGIYDPPVTDNDVLDMTGPGMFTDAVFTYLRENGDASFKAMHFMEKPIRFGDAVVMPLWVFSPGSIQTASSRPTYSRNHLDPEAMVLHKFLGSWRDGKY